jgi:Domain of unknown function (DUF4265)
MFTLGLKAASAGLTPSSHLKSGGYMTEKVKILFRLQKDEDGYPPAEIESLWSDRLDNDTYALDNIPVYLRGISEKDIVGGINVEGEIFYSHFIEASEYSTYRIMLNDSGDDREISQRLISMGCSIERSNIPRLIAVSVPPYEDADAIHDYMVAQENNGKFEFEEAALRGPSAKFL